MAKGIDLIASVMGPPGEEGRKDAKDSNEADEGAETELTTHLRAYEKAMRQGQMSAAEESFRAAVAACGGYDKME